MYFYFRLFLYIFVVLITGCAITLKPAEKTNFYDGEVTIFRESSFIGAGANLHISLNGKEYKLNPIAVEKVVLPAGMHTIKKIRGSDFLGLEFNMISNWELNFHINPGEAIRIGTSFYDEFNFYRYDQSGKLINKSPLYVRAVDRPSSKDVCGGIDVSQWSNCFGTTKLANGDTYIGEFWSGKAQGQGTYTFSNGSKYVGKFKFGKFDGQGTFTSANGNKYVGETMDNKMHGQGTYTWVNGDKYVGEFRDDQRSGQGVYIFADGKPPQEGVWEKNKFLRAQRIPDHIAGRTSPTAPAVAQITPPVPQTYRQEEPISPTITLSVSTSQPDANGVVTLSISSTSDTVSLKINGQEEGGRADGRYSVNRFAKVGSNSFEVIATDRYGNTQKQTVVVNREIQVVAEKARSLNPTLISAAKPRDAVAIIIGIEKYRRVPDADFANNDASTFYDYARRALGIKPENIRLLVDDKADSGEILRSFKTWLPTRVNKNTTDVYVFYSGHGLPSEDGGSLYFLPHEVDRDLLERTAITQKEVVQAIQRTTPKSVTMFIDSCYSGQSRTGTSLLASARPISIAPKVSTDFPPNFMVISASAPDQISSSSPELKHGIFSYYLMLGMEGEADVNKDGQITVGEMQTYLSQQVTRRAIGMNRTQSPQTTGDLNRVLVQASSKTR
jgi:hypothetical protein